ncbi:hypothetical protein [Granulicoccus phenolivorans]|uniref:hypothetical protein n=1 Tax=Granulicoccus phenolivorans TaxID=266854 RepID=UPI00040F7167|nr:hypothetical protein [Granulicoccus phenolivorans]
MSSPPAGSAPPPPAPPGPRPYLDPTPLDPRWPAPRPRRTQSRLGTAVLTVLAALLLVGGTVWAAGGLEERADQYTSIAPGLPVELGAIRVVLTHAEIVSPSNRSRFSADKGWAVTAYGSVENLTDRPTILPTTDGVSFARTSAGPGAVTVTGAVDRVAIQTDAELLAGNAVPPALGPVTLTVTVNYPADWEPTDQLYVAFPTYRLVGDSLRPSDHAYAGSWLPARVVVPDN